MGYQNAARVLRQARPCSIAMVYFPGSHAFTIYALSVAKLDVTAESSGAMVTSTVKEHLLGKAVFVAHYGR